MHNGHLVKTNPNEPNFQYAKMSLSSYSTKDYGNKLRFQNEPKNEPNFSIRQNESNLLYGKDLWRYNSISKRTQNEPNFTRPNFIHLM
jgi:hypothetical protein